MSYGQKNYNEIQGINGRYRINQIGCLLTGFSNLLTERLGKPVDPLALNAALRDRSIYIDVDDGVRDDLGWGSVTQYDSSVIVAASVTKAINDSSAGWPNSNNSIVRFYYRSVQTGNMITHFALVADAGAHTIVDSWDGVVKQNPYGEPTGWASYEVHNPAPVIPATPPPAPTPEPAPNRFEAITPVDLVVNKQPTEVWDLSSTSWATFKPVANLNQGDHFQAVAIYHHPLGGKYYVHTNGDMQGINIVDAQIAPPTPPPSAESPKAAEPVKDESPSESIPVHVIPADPNAWQHYNTLVRDYIATESIVVKDLAGVESDLQLVKDQIVHGGGVFIKDGITYVITQKSIQNKSWYGIPTGSLKPDEQDEEELYNLDWAKEAKELLNNLTAREKFVAFTAKFQGVLLSLLRKLSLRKAK